jgi:hypothetical protein
MVIDPGDADTVSGRDRSFIQPVLDAERFARHGAPSAPSAWATMAPRRVAGRRWGRSKTRAWLIERAGIHRGHGNPSGIAISGKHTWPLTPTAWRGSDDELIARRARIAGGVRGTRSAIALVPRERCLSGSESGRLGRSDRLASVAVRCASEQGEQRPAAAGRATLPRATR